MGQFGAAESVSFDPGDIPLLEGKVILATGANSGLCRLSDSMATYKRVRLVVADSRNPSNLDETFKVVKLRVVSHPHLPIVYLRHGMVRPRLGGDFGNWDPRIYRDDTSRSILIS